MASSLEAVRCLACEVGHRRLWSVGVTLIVGGSGLVGLATHPWIMSSRPVVSLAWLSCALLWLVGSALLAIRWRWHRKSPSAWLASGGIAIGVFVATFGVVEFAAPQPHTVARPDGLGGVFLAVVVFVMVRMAAGHRPFRFPAGPAGLGLAVSGLALLGELVIGTTGQVLGARQSVRIIAALTVAVLGAASVATIERLPWLEARARFRLTLAGSIVVVTAALAPSYLYPSVASFIGLALGAVASSVFCAEAINVLSRSRPVNGATSLGSDVVDARRIFDEQLHELRAALAGMSTAVELLVHHDQDLSRAWRDRLEGMVQEELGRLQRLLARREAVSLEVLDIAEVVSPLVTCRRLSGQEIHLDAGRASIVADRDLLIEAIGGLLANAERHAPGAVVWISVEEERTSTRIRVSDNGPGVPPELRETLFDRGAHRDGSGGQGLGLHLARQVARAQGGDLWLEPTPPGQGASFVIAVRRHLTAASA